jgi:hypothetical protein
VNAARARAGRGTPAFVPPVGGVLGPVRPYCKRCRKPVPGNVDDTDWNITWVASYATGYLCPDCQTDEEDLEAQIDEVIGDNKQVQQVGVNIHLETYANQLLAAYRTPDVMRAKADELAAARPDLITGPVRLMRHLADTDAWTAWEANDD